MYNCKLYTRPITWTCKHDPLQNIVKVRYPTQLHITHACMRVNTDSLIHAYSLVYMRPYVHITVATQKNGIGACAHAWMHMYIFICPYLCLYSYISISLYIYIYIVARFKHIYIYIYK